MRYIPYKDGRKPYRAPETAGPPIPVQPDTGPTIGEKGVGAAIFLAIVLMFGAALYLIQPPSDRAQDVAAILTPDGE